MAVNKATGGDAARTRCHKGTESPKTLAEQRISKKESRVAQAVAWVAKNDPDLFRSYRERKVPLKALVRAAWPGKASVVSDRPSPPHAAATPFSGPGLFRISPF